MPSDHRLNLALELKPEWGARVLEQGGDDFSARAMNAAPLVVPARPHFLKWWLPSIGVCIWLAYFFAVQLSDHRQFLISTDGGASLHWRIGDWMIEHRTILRIDPFSYTRPDAPVISKEWLSEVIVAAVANLFGWSGVVLLAAL